MSYFWRLTNWPVQFLLWMCLSASMAMAETSFEIEAGPGYGLNGNANSSRYEFQLEHELSDHWAVDGLYRVAKPNNSLKWDQKYEAGVTRDFGLLYFRLAGGYMVDQYQTYNFYNLMPGIKLPLNHLWDVRIAYRFIHSLPGEKESANSQTYRLGLEYKYSKDMKLKLKWDHERREMNEFAVGISYSWD